MAIMCVLMVLCGWAGAGEIWYVDDDGPADFSTIQAALDASWHGDSIVVRDGCYTGDGNRDIDFRGLEVHLKSENGPGNCIIECGGSEAEPHRGFAFTRREGPGSIVDGFTIRGGNGSAQSPGSAGGAIYCRLSSPTITNCILSGNSAVAGGAVYCVDSSVVISDSEIAGNVLAVGSSGAPRQYGSALLASGGSPSIIGCIVSAGCVLTPNRSARDAAICAWQSCLTIADSTVSGNDGNAVLCLQSELIAARNTITDNERRGIILEAGCGATIAGNLVAGNGGGIGCYATPADVIGNTIVANVVTESGAGLYCGNETYFVATNNVIACNRSGERGGGFWCSGEGVAALFLSNTLFGNEAPAGGAVWVYYGATLKVADCVLWQNTTPQIHLDGGAAAQVSYSNVPGGRLEASVGTESALLWGPGNTDADPLLADPDNGDYHLRSAGGRWDVAANAGAGGWVYDNETSPCIDAGDPESDFSAEAAPNGGRVNMGAYGGTPAASRSAMILSVGSAPIGSVEIGGTAPGVTDYGEALVWQDEVTLTAPAVVVRGEVHYAFVGWTVDGETLAPGQTTIQVTMDENHAATAVYEVRTQTLSVRSWPIDGLSVTGDRPGMTDYAVECGYLEEVSLSLGSPLVVSAGTRFYSFAYWAVDGEPQEHGQVAVEVLMDVDHVVTAVYLLYGDTNGDCRVNVLDLIFVRNRLGKHAGTGDNWRADVVGVDGKVNVLDLIAVRNELGAECAASAQWE